MKSKILICFLMFLASLPGFAQNLTVTGKVTEKNSGMAALGAGIMIKGTDKGTIADADGNYTLENVPSNATIVFSSVGMLSQEVAVAGRTTINIELLEDTQMLEETIVVGYGTAKSKDLTAPIQNIKGDAIVSQPTSSPMAALQGKVAGVTVTNSGTPGAGPKVTIRGMGSFGDTSPLFVVDGMFFDNIDFLNNADIQDLTIMKDASASAIYGVRAANGVVIITTKKGAKNQDAKITYNGYIGMQKATNLLEMCNSHEYATMLMEANPDAYKGMLQESINQWGGDFNTLSFNADTNWYDELLRTAMMTNHSVNVSGGTERATYSAGLSYLYQNGIMNTNNDYNRTNFRAQLDYDATKWLKIGFSGVFSKGQQQLPKNNAWAQAFNMPGIFPVYDNTRDASIFTDGYASPEQMGVTNNFYNPVATANYYDSRNDTYQALSNFYAQVNFIPEKLNFRTSYGYDFSLVRGTNFTPTYQVGTVGQKNEHTSLTKTDSNYTKSIWDNVLTYTDQWGRHGFTGMVGMSVRDEQYHKLTGTATDVPAGKDAWKYLALGNKEGATVSDDGYIYRGLSYFTRLSYNYDSRYMLTATFRADGSSKYNDKWGYFPSVGAAWVISNESFMKDQNIVDYLKLRASWGMLGNDKIAASAGFASISNSNAIFGTNTRLDGALTSSNFSWLGWEVVKETNVGLNFGTLDNRLNGDIDWFHRLTDNAVISPKVPMQNITLAGNYGQILNSGVDITLDWNDKLSNDFSYNVGLNLSFLHNKVKSLKDNMQIIKGGKTVNMVGEKMNSFYGYKVIGIYQTPEECAADPIAVANSLVPGDFKYEDVNKDGVMDGADKQILGSYIPDLTYGFNIGFTWKKLDFNANFYGQAGAELWNRKRALRYASSNFNFDKNQYDNRWTGAGSTNENPSAAALIKTWNISDSNNASYFVESANFFRVQNISLGYSFSNVKIGSYTLPGLRLSAMADRPFSFFKANSFTPELSDSEGWDTEIYPLTATYSFSVQIDF